MKDRFERDLQPRDIVLFSGSKEDWRFGIVGSVEEHRVTLYIGYYNWSGTIEYSTTTRRSQDRLLILEGGMAKYAMEHEYPFASEDSPADFMKYYEKYLETL